MNATNALVELQGRRTLDLLTRHPNHAEYEVIGFHGTVTIHDYRPTALAALDAAIAGRVAGFPDAFSQPAMVALTIVGDDIRVRLDEPRHAKPDHLLWIAVGLESELPVLDYVVAKFEYLDDDSLAVVALCRLATTAETVALPLFAQEGR